MIRKYILLSILLFPLAYFASVRYVTVPGAGIMNGTSWLNAAPGNSLQATINLANNGDEVWVACGTYFTTNTANRNISFVMRNGITIYGSFVGNETSLSQRTLSCGACTILTGEIGAVGIADNSYHVISNPVGINNTAVIDGFVVRDANDDRPAAGTSGLGGGFYNQGDYTGNFCNPTIRNCVIRNNYAQFGAGIFNSGSSGGMSSPVISNCIITANTAYIGGGGIDNFGLGGTASPALINTIVYGNNAQQRAGGMYCWGGNNGNASPTLTNCVFANNSAIDGGGIVSDRLNSNTGSSGNSNPTLVNCIFWGNTASGIGPQFFILGGASFIATYSDVDLTGQSMPHIISGSGTGNIHLNPLFTNPISAMGTDNCWLTSDDGLHLQTSSPAINAGTSAGVPLTDILGLPRDGNPDMGTYEFQTSVSIDEIQGISELNIYPNPTTGIFKIEGFTSEIKKLTITNSLGELLPFSSKGEGTIDLSYGPNGIYFLYIETSGKAITKKIIKK